MKSLVSNFNENTVPKSTKEVKKIGLKLFQGKNCVVKRCLTLFCEKIFYNKFVFLKTHLCNYAKTITHLGEVNIAE